MRDFEERKTEIFRRSKERLAQRRRRRRIIISCIPLVICIAVLSVFKMPVFELKTDKSAPNDCNQTVSAGEYISVRIQGKGENSGYSKIIEDQELVEKIVNSISGAASEETGDESSDPTDNKLAGAHQDAVDATVEGTCFDQGNSEASYTIIIVDADGSERIYTISGDVLIGEKGGSIVLSDKQLSEIESLLMEAQ